MTLIAPDGSLHFVHDGEAQYAAYLIERGYRDAETVQDTHGAGDGGSGHDAPEPDPGTAAGELGAEHSGGGVRNRSEGEGEGAGGYGGAAQLDLHPDEQGSLQQRQADGGTAGSVGKSTKGRTSTRKGG